MKVRMRKPIALLSAFVLSLALFGCSGVENKENAQISSAARTTQEEQEASENSTGVSSTRETNAGSLDQQTGKAENREANSEVSRFYIYVNDQTLSVAASGNSSSDALIGLLSEGDITIDAHDYGNFEKVGSLPQSLPTNDEQITTEPGDVILYQGNQITVYYDTNSWNFTRLGKIENTSAEELKQILGDGNVELRLSLS